MSSARVPSLIAGLLVGLAASLLWWRRTCGDGMVASGGITMDGGTCGGSMNLLGSSSGSACFFELAEAASAAGRGGATRSSLERVVGSIGILWNDVRMVAAEAAAVAYR